MCQFVLQHKAVVIFHLFVKSRYQYTFTLYDQSTMSTIKKYNEQKQEQKPEFST